MEQANRRFKKNQPAVIGIFKDHSTLEETLNELKLKKFHNEDISLFMAKREDFKEFNFDNNSTYGATVGVFTGIAAGGILGWLASLNMLFLPGAGPFIVAGPIVGAIAGAALGGTVGSVAGVLIGVGLSELEAKRLEHFVKDKGVVVSVHVNDPKSQLVAKNILLKHNALKIYNPQFKKPSKFFTKKIHTNKLSEV